MFEVRLPEQHIHGKLRLHHEQVGGTDEAHHNVRGHISQAIWLLRKVAQ